MSSVQKPIVLVDIHHLKNDETGLRKYTEELIGLAREFPSDDFKYVFVPDPKTYNQTKGVVKPKTIWSKLLLHLEIFLWKQFYIPYRSWKEKAEIVFFPDYYASLWKLRAHKCVIFHDTFFWDTPEHYGKLWGRYFRWVSVRGALNGATVFSISEFAKSKVQKIFPEPIDVKVILHAKRNMNSLIEHHSGIVDKLGLKNKKYFLHVGVFEKRKNLPLLVMAFNDLAKNNESNDYQLVLVGNRASTQHFDDYDTIVALVKKYNLESRVVFTGYLSDGEISELYRNAWCYVFPSLNEGFGIPVLEAFEMSCPVIVSDQPALIEVAGGAALQFKSTSHLSLVEKMHQLEENIELRSMLIKKGLERLTFFRREDYISKLDAYFRGIINKESLN